MTANNDGPATDEIEEFTSRLRRLDDPKWAALANAPTEEVALLMDDVKGWAGALATQLALMGVEYCAFYRSLVSILRTEAEMRFLLGEIAALPWESDSSLPDVPLPTNPGAVVRAGLDEVYVRDACGLWSGDSGTLVVGDGAMRAHAALRLEVLSEGVRLDG